jgi:predicted PurR-regulated permease PerM
MAISKDAAPGGGLGQLRKGSTPDCADGPEAEERLEMPSAQDLRTIFQGILCVIAVLACLYVAQDIVLPIVLALVLKLLLQPLVSFLERLHMPRAAGALVALALLLSVFLGLGMLLSSPAARWVSELPQTWPQLQQKFAFMKEPSEQVQGLLDRMGMRITDPSSLLSNLLVW